MLCGPHALNLSRLGLSLLCGDWETEPTSSVVVNALSIPLASGLWLSPGLDTHIILPGMTLQWWASSQTPREQLEAAGQESRVTPLPALQRVLR